MHIPDQPTRWLPRAGKTVATLGTLLLTVLVPACGVSDRTEEPTPVVDIHNPGLGVTIVGMPPTWAVKINENERLELIPSDASRPGLVSVRVGPEERGINLVAAVDAHRAMIESHENGLYSGARELSGPLGVAFYSRGSYEEHASVIEETRIFALHPTASRLLVLDYTYPAADDSSTRVSELIELFALVE